MFLLLYWGCSPEVMQFLEIMARVCHSCQGDEVSTLALVVEANKCWGSDGAPAAVVL